MAGSYASTASVLNPIPDPRDGMIDATGGIDVKLPYDEARAINDEIRPRALGDDEA